MGINNLFQEIQNTNWNLTDDFKVYINTANEKLSVDNILENTNMIWEKSVISIDIPPLSAPPMEQYLGGEWRIGSTKPEIFRFSMRFRDFNNGELKRYFETLFAYSLYNYPKDSFINIKVTNNSGDVLIFSSERILIEQVSETQYTSGDSNISEFSIQFRTPIYSDAFINGLGSKEYSRKFGVNS